MKTIEEIITVKVTYKIRYNEMRGGILTDRDDAINYVIRCLPNSGVCSSTIGATCAELCAVEHIENT